MSPAIPRNRDELARVDTAQWQQLLSGPPAELARWLQGAAALDDAMAQAMLGQLHLEGQGVDKDAASAYGYFAAAAAQDYPMAMNMCGRCLEHGWGVAVDLPQAGAWYRRAAEHGLDWGMYNYANLLATGKGVACDQQAALHWYRQAAALGHAKSLNLVGRYYEEGIAVAADRNTAFKYYRASAEAGDFRGQYSYACMLAERGRIGHAVAWLKRVPETATIGFMKKAGYELQLSAHAEFRALARQMLARAGGFDCATPEQHATC